MEKNGKITWWIPLIAVLITSSVLIYLQFFTTYFEQKNVYYAKYNSIEGVTESADVQVKGFKIGEVYSIDILSSSITTEILVTFKIEDPNYKIPYGTIVEVVKSDLLGKSILKLNYADTNAYHNYGDTLSATPEANLEATVALSLNPIIEKTDGLKLSFDSMMTIFRSLKDDAKRQQLLSNVDEIKRLLVTVDHISEQLSAASENEKWRLTLIERNIEEIKNNIAMSDTVLSYILVNYNSIQNSIAKSNIDNAVMASNIALAEVDAVIGQINRGAGTIGLLIHNEELSAHLAQANTDLALLLADYDKHPEHYVKVSLFNKRNKKNQDQFLTDEQRETLKNILEGKKNGNK